MDFLKIALSSLGTLVALFLFTKIMGNREMSQLSMFDYVSSITIGSIAGEMAVMTTDSFMKPFVAMAVFSFFAMLISYVTCKSIVLRRFFEGHALLLYQNGQIFEKNLLKAKLDVDEFLASCRLSGFFDLEEIQSVYLETNGTVSILPKALHRPATPSDLNLSPSETAPLANVIIDGKIFYDNLKSTGKNEAWLRKQLQQKGNPDMKEVILATFDSSKDTINVYLKFNRKMTRDIFE
ncbi:MAG: hypothetical protein H6Q59_2737 [Firmicutes bacterium]|nr:hypothetical protein [Bacillota bacterium]